MKKFFSMLLMLPAFLMAQDKFTVNGTLDGLPDGSAVSISDLNSPTDTLARTTVKGGAFELNGAVDEPNLVHLNFDGVKRKAVLFIGNEKIRIQGKIDSVLDVLVTGSRVHDDFEVFKKTFNPLFERLSVLGQKINTAGADTKSDSLTTQYQGVLTEVKSAVDDFIAKNPASPVSAFVVLVTSELEQDPATLRRRFETLDKNAQTGFYGNIVKSRIDTDMAGAIGSQAIEFSQADPDGKQVSLSSFRGKYVLIDFWASWCKPCRMENPNVVRAYQKFKNKNFTVLGISLDRDRDAWLKAIKEDNLAWTQLSDLQFWNNAVAAKYKIQSIPQNFLVDPDGKIVGKNLRGADLEAALSKLIK